MIFYELVIRSIALRRCSPNRISRIEAPVDQFLIPIRHNLANNIVIFAIRWAGKSDLNTDETLDGLFGPHHLGVDLFGGSGAEILVSPSVRANLMTLAIGEFNACDAFFSIDAAVYI